MNKKNNLIVYRKDELEKVENLIKITNKLLLPKEIIIESHHWEWWYKLDKVWQILFLKTIRIIKSKNLDYYLENFRLFEPKDFMGIENQISTNELEQIINSKHIIIGKNVEIKNSIVGPHVSIGENTVIKNSVISNSIIQTNTIIRSANFKDSMIGNHTRIKGKVNEYSIGDFNELD